MADNTILRAARQAGMEQGASPLPSPHGPALPWQPGLFRSFVMGGGESSSHRREDGRQLDLIAATRHDEQALEDYELLRTHGIGTVRDALRWHLIEAAPGRYD